MNIIPYKPSDKEEWNAFVRQARNGTLLFERDYMDYHADRFDDASLMFRDDRGRLVAVLPANLSDGELWSHRGLTYGGLVTGLSVTASDVLSMVQNLVAYARQAGWKAIHLKPVPTDYQRVPAQDEEYALWRCGAVLESCQLASVVCLDETRIKPTTTNRYYHTRHRQGQDLRLEADTPLEAYWPLLEASLKERYGARPVHALDEIKRLQAAFPQAIRCFTVHQVQAPGAAGQSAESSLLGGVVAYLTGRVFHIQYSAASPQGRDAHALAWLYQTLMDQAASEGYAFFDMGTSNEENGRVLNASLDFWKWSLGGRGITYKMYVMPL